MPAWRKTSIQWKSDPNRQKRFRNVSETFPMQAKMQTETFLNFFSQKVARNVKEACQGTS